jgi:hypothetical protein
MDLRAYYRKVREAEASLTGEHMVMVSFATPEGGKEGVRTEVPRSTAARLLAEGVARIATDDETADFREQMRAAREKHERDEAARRIQVTVVPSHELTRRSSKPAKERN